jgi:hypothetical protein
MLHTPVPHCINALTVLPTISGNVLSIICVVLDDQISVEFFSELILNVIFLLLVKFYLTWLMSVTRFSVWFDFSLLYESILACLRLYQLVKYHSRYLIELRLQYFHI